MVEAAKAAAPAAKGDAAKAAASKAAAAPKAAAPKATAAPKAAAPKAAGAAAAPAKVLSKKAARLAKLPKKLAAATAYVQKRRKHMRKRKSLRYKLPGRAEKRMPKLRASLKPGTVLILLSGGHRGKRVIFLKQLSPSGLLLVTGPFKINGVPLRRVNHRYVIATSTRVDISGVGNLDSITDKRFGQKRKAKIAERKLRHKQDESMFVQQTDAKIKQALPDEAKKLQDTVDKSILTALDKDKLLAQYLKTRFTLRSGMLPHAMKF